MLIWTHCSHVVNGLRSALLTKNSSTHDKPPPGGFSFAWSLALPPLLVAPPSINRLRAVFCCLAEEEFTFALNYS